MGDEASTPSAEATAVEAAVAPTAASGSPAAAEFRPRQAGGGWAGPAGRADRRPRIVRVAWADPRAVELRAAMDAEVGPRYAERRRAAPHANGALQRAFRIDAADLVVTLLVLDADDRPVGHASLRDLGGEHADALEVKRVYVRPEARGTGVSIALMAALEAEALAAGRPRLVLQTGDRQPDAVALYEKLGYTRIPIYAPYLDLPYSNCFEKRIAPRDAG